MKTRSPPVRRLRAWLFDRLRGNGCLLCFVGFLLIVFCAPIIIFFVFWITWQTLPQRGRRRSQIAASRLLGVPSAESRSLLLRA